MRTKKEFSIMQNIHGILVRFSMRLLRDGVVRVRPSDQQQRSQEMLDATLMEQLPDTMTVEQDGKPMPIREHPFVKEAKDFPTFVKTAFDAHKEVGARVRIPGKDAKPEDVMAFKTRLIESGVLPAPLKSPDDYGLVKPETMPDGLEWHEEGAKKLAAMLHKHGAPKELGAELLE